GGAQAALDLLGEGRDTLLRVQNLPAVPNEPAPFAGARKEAAELARELGERIPSLAVAVSGVPEGTPVEVRIDGTLLSPSAVGLRRKLNPRQHVVVVSAPGFVEARETIALKEREQRVVTIELRRESPMPVAPPAAPAPRPAPKPPPVTFGPTEPAPAQAEGAAVSPLAWAGFGVGAVGLVVGTVTGIVTLSKAADIDEQCPGGPCPDSARENYDAAMALSYVSTAGFAVGGAGIVTGLVGLLALGTGPEPAAAAGGGGVAVRPVLGLGAASVKGWF
ncbi:MAG: hypothetical protein HY744_30910, partial [Deltaproteobacteria bacterium]|nr:hypothetical protein [Deltaproteobacteria bacterium]